MSFSAKLIEKESMEGLKNSLLKKQLAAFMKKDEKEFLAYVESQIIYYADLGCTGCDIEPIHKNEMSWFNTRKKLEARGFVYESPYQGSTTWRVLWGAAARLSKSK